MEREARNVVLTGFRATGKSTVGRLLAKRLGYAFVDADALLCDRLGCTIAECVAQHGWERFRQEERRLLGEIPAMTGTVLATGGGAIEHRREWQGLRGSCFVVWLDADLATIQQRLGGDPGTKAQRPSLTGASVEDEVEQVLRRRLPLYDHGSDLHLQTAGVAPERLAEMICEKMTALTKAAELSGKVAGGTSRWRERGNG